MNLLVLKCVYRIKRSSYLYSVKNSPLSYVGHHSLSKNFTSNRCIWPKNSISNSDGTRVLAAQSCKCNSIAISHIALEVDESHWEDKDITLWRTLVIRRFSGFEETNPTMRETSRTVRISDARGCVWGGLMPHGA